VAIWVPAGGSPAIRRQWWRFNDVAGWSGCWLLATMACVLPNPCDDECRHRAIPRRDITRALRELNSPDTVFC